MKRRVTFDKYSGTSSFLSYKIRSKELAEYLGSIEDEEYICNVRIYSDYISVEYPGGCGDSYSIDDVVRVYFHVLEDYGYGDEKMFELYGSWTDCCEKWKKKGNELSPDEIQDIIYKITGNEEPKEVTEKLTEMLKAAENVDYEGAEFTSD